MRVERVTWLDTGLAISDGWMTPAHILEHATNQLVTSVGFVMYEDDDRLILTGTFAADIDQHLNAQSISKIAIRQREDIA
jgi:hypothetical protein